MKIRYMILIFFSITVFSGTVYEFSNVEDEKRFNALIKDIRCPKCSSGSLSSSNAPVSEDLKLKIAEMINENKTDNEIKYYVVSRFGKDSLSNLSLAKKLIYYGFHLLLSYC